MYNDPELEYRKDGTIRIVRPAGGMGSTGTEICARDEQGKPISFKTPEDAHAFAVERGWKKPKKDGAEIYVRRYPGDYDKNGYLKRG